MAKITKLLVSKKFLAKYRKTKPMRSRDDY